jgi:CheY-like chemotaxis protein
LIDQSGHEFEVTVPDIPAFIYADPVRIVQVLSNLLNNAARCTRPGGRLRLKVELTDDELSFAVSDTGRGIRPEALERIFDMFVQERDGGGGLGIGLTLVRRLVELHDGSVAAHSAGLGKGSTFTVRLPLTQAAAGASEQRQDAPSTRTLRIVLVEDDPDIREMMQALLESWGHQVQVSETGTAGAELIVSSRPNVALVDIGLPGINGCDVARLVRYVHPPEHVRLIALTGYSQEADRRRIENAGFDAHLVKPATAQTLQDALARCAPPVEPTSATDARALARVDPSMRD